MDTMSTPRRPGLSSWRDRIPPQALAEADRLGPLGDDRRESDEDRAERLALQAEHRAARWRARLPLLFTEASMVNLLDDAEQREPAKVMLRWLDDSDALNLVLAGSVGTGKTYAAYALGNEAVMRGMWVEGWTLADLLTAMRPDGDPRAGELARSAELLVIDDLGATKVSDWAQETMTALLDARTREGKRTIITTNLPGLQPISDAWGGRFRDRLKYRMTALTLTGESRREETKW